MPRPAVVGVDGGVAAVGARGSAYATSRSPSKTPTVLGGHVVPGRCQSATMSASSITTSPTSASSWAAITAVDGGGVGEEPRLRWVSPSGSSSGAGMDAIGHARDSDAVAPFSGEMTLTRRE